MADSIKKDSTVTFNSSHFRPKEIIMKPGTLICTFAMLCLLGCTTSHELLSVEKGGEGNSVSFATFNTYARDRFVSLTLTNGAQLQGAEIFVRNDSTSFLNDESGTLQTVSTSAIMNMEIKSRTLGTLEGALLGSAIGACAFAGIRSIMDSGAELSTSNLSLSPIIGSGAARGAAIGGLAGALVGLARGHTYRYEVKSDSLRVAVSVR